MMLARAFRMKCQLGQHPKEPIAAEKRRHTDIQPRIEHNSEEFIKIYKATTWHKDGTTKRYLQTKEDSKLPYVYYA